MNSVYGHVLAWACNDHEVDQNLATNFFSDFPTELPTMVTMLAVLGYEYILTDDQ